MEPSKEVKEALRTASESTSQLQRELLAEYFFEVRNEVAALEKSIKFLKNREKFLLSRFPFLGQAFGAVKKGSIPKKLLEEAKESEPAMTDKLPEKLQDVLLLAKKREAKAAKRMEKKQRSQLRSIKDHLMDPTIPK